MKAELVQEDYSSLITECFETDPELLQKWHIKAPASLEICVEDTVKALEFSRVSVYKLTISDKTIGYFGVESFNSSWYLTGFFIKPEYRNKENFELFWNIVNKEFSNKNYYAGVYKKNERAINFLLRSGGIKAWENVDNGSVFIMMNWGS